MNERTHFFIKIYLSHFTLERVDFGCEWEVSWRWKQTAAYWPQDFLTIASLLSHSGRAAQPWVTESPKPSVCRWLSLRHLVSNWFQLQLELTQAICGTWLYNCLCPPASAVPPLIYTGASLDWWLGQGSIYNSVATVSIVLVDYQFIACTIIGYYFKFNIYTLSLLFIFENSRLY